MGQPPFNDSGDVGWMITYTVLFTALTISFVLALMRWIESEGKESDVQSNAHDVVCHEGLPAD